MEVSGSLDWGTGKLSMVLTYSDVEDTALLDAIHERIEDLCEQCTPKNGATPEETEQFINTAIGGLVTISSEIGTAFKTGEYYD